MLDEIGEYRVRNHCRSSRVLGPFLWTRLQLINTSFNGDLCWSSLWFLSLSVRDVVLKLLQFEASTNVPDNKGCFPLHLAAWRGDVDIVRILMHHGPSHCRVNEQVYTPFPPRLSLSDCYTVTDPSSICTNSTKLTYPIKSNQSSWLRANMREWVSDCVWENCLEEVYDDLGHIIHLRVSDTSSVCVCL